MSRLLVALVMLAMIGSVRAGPVLEVALTGSVAKSCAVSGPPADIDLGALDGAGSRTFTLDVSCNAPFSWEISAQHGALVPASPVVFVGTFEDRIPYSLRFRLPLEDGTPGLIDVTCTGAELADPAASCGRGESGTAVAIGATATVTLAWGTPLHPRLAGAHAETLTFSLRVRP